MPQLNDNINIQMVDLNRQYLRIKDDVDSSIQAVINEARFVKGKIVRDFEENLEKYLGVSNVISCGNGTDALQIAFMALDLNQGDEVIVPSFTYVATAEVLKLLGLQPVLVDVDLLSYNININQIESAITSKTKAIVPVHLFGQCANMEPILEIAKKYNLYVVEDTAQALGAVYKFSDGSVVRAGCIGDIGTTSFFPSKNLGAFGDGGAMFTNNQELADKIRMIANHGQKTQYYHDIVGVNSRLDTIQAAILDIKLKYLDEYEKRRFDLAQFYTRSFSDINQILTPQLFDYSSHVFHQYTIQVDAGIRNELKAFLAQKGIPTMIYYPLPLHKQKAFADCVFSRVSLEVSDSLCGSVLSLPMHTEMHIEEQDYIVSSVGEFFNFK